MTSRRILISTASVVALALLALLAWFLRKEPHATTAANAWSASESHSGSSALSSMDGGARRDAAGDRARISTVLVGAHVPSFTDVDGVRLVVVDALTRAPVAGAEVHAWEDETGRFFPTSNCEHWMGPDAEAFIAARTKPLLTDEEGNLDLPYARMVRFVTARAGKRFGLARLDGYESGLLELAVAPSHDLDVIVRDTAGQPQRGVRVALGPFDNSMTFWDRVTDEHGHCRLPDFEMLVHQMDADPSTLVAVRIAMPFDPPVEDWIEPAHLPESPIELVMPSSGSVRVTIVDDDHHCVPVSGSIVISTEDLSVMTRLRPDRVLPRGQFALENGVARVDGIGLGQALQIDSELLGSGNSGVRIDGPRTAGEVVEAEVPFWGTLIRARLVDESGQPLAHRAFGWYRFADDGMGVTGGDYNVVVTDEDGRFTWTLPNSIDDAGPNPNLTGFLCEVSPASMRRQAVLSLVRPIPTWVVDFGDVVAAVRPALASGRVVDAQGHGVAAGVCLMADWTKDHRQPRYVTSTNVTDPDGRFEIFAPCLPVPLRLQVSGPEIERAQVLPFTCSSAPITVTVGVNPIGSLTGTALIGRDDQTEQLSVRFVADGAKAGEAHQADLVRAGDRVCFFVQNVPPSHGRVEFHCDASSPALLAVVPDVTVVRARETRPPQLVDVDLRGKLPKITATPPAPADELEIVDARGESVPRGIVWTTNPADEQTRRAWTAGRVRIAAPDAKLVEVWAAGFREKVLPVQRTGRVVLEPELELEVAFDLPRDLLERGNTLKGTLIYAAQPGEEFVPSALNGQATFVLDEQGRAVVHLPAAGTFEASLALHRSGVPGLEDVDDYGLPLDSAPLIILDVPGRQTVTCKLDADRWTEMLPELGLSKN